MNFHNIYYKIKFLKIICTMKKIIFSGYLANDKHVFVEIAFCGYNYEKFDEKKKSVIYVSFLGDDGVKKHGVDFKLWTLDSLKANGYDEFCSAVDDIKTINGLKDKKKFVFRNSHHVTTVDDGVIFDTWDTSEECVWSFWYK